MTDAALKLEDVPEEARPHFQKQLADMTYNQKVVKRFHLWPTTSLTARSVISHLDRPSFVVERNHDGTTV